MRYFVVFFALIIYSNLAACNKLDGITKEGLIAIVTGCKNEAGASDADFENVFKHLPQETKEGSCMIACTYRKFGLINDEAKIIKDAAIEIMKRFIKNDEKKELAVGIYESCEDLVTSDDQCEVAVAYDNCIRKKFLSEEIFPTKE